MRDDPWNDERIALLRRLWAEGATARAIAERLGGVSRSAILGKIFRLRRDVGAAAPPLGPASKPPAPDARAETRPSAEGTAAAGVAATSVLPKSLARRRASKRGALPKADAPERKRGKTLLELTNASCRWIVEAVVKWMVSSTLTHFH